MPTNLTRKGQVTVERLPSKQKMAAGIAWNDADRAPWLDTLAAALEGTPSHRLL